MQERSAKEMRHFIHELLAHNTAGLTQGEVTRQFRPRTGQEKWCFYETLGFLTVLGSITFQREVIRDRFVYSLSVNSWLKREAGIPEGPVPFLEMRPVTESSATKE